MKLCDNTIKKYGRNITVYDESDNIVNQTKCIIQPLRYKNKMYTQGTPTEIGIAQAGYYLMIAPSDFIGDNIDEYGRISDGNKNYHLDRTEKVYFGDSVMYVWAILRERNVGQYPVYDHFT